VRQNLKGFDESTERATAMACRRGWPLVGWWAMLVFFLCLLAACGYRISGGGRLPGGIKTIAVEVFTNRSAESGLETTLTNAVIDELTRRRPEVVVAVEGADGILSGTIDRLTSGTLARGGTLTAVERNLVIMASFVLKDRSGKVLWQGRQLKAEQAYAVGENKASTDMNRRLAAGLVSERLAEYLFERLTDAF